MVCDWFEVGLRLVLGFWGGLDGLLMWVGVGDLVVVLGFGVLGVGIIWVCGWF